MNGVDSTVKECDPCAFYWIAYEKVNTAETAQKYANIITGIFIILFAPAIIIAPFLAKKLNVLTRKIIAMIVLSDTVKVVFNGIMANRRDNYEADIAKYISECTVVTIVQSAASLWSMSWYVCCIIYIYITNFTELFAKVLLNIGNDFFSIVSKYCFLQNHLNALMHDKLKDYQTNCECILRLTTPKFIF